MNPSSRMARRIVRGLIERGITDVVLSPGSRNAPLSTALYVAEQRGLITLHVRIDERGAAFFALGISKAQRRAVAIVCTSGTAVANYHPAVLEAYHSQVPLLVITADRPERLRQTGANQTTLQAKFFGEATSFAVDTANPDYDFGTAFDALATGPVHLNIQFDEPLLPTSTEPWLINLSDRKRSTPFTPKSRELKIDEPHGVIVVGHDRAGLEVEAITAFADAIGWPLIAEDPLSFDRAIPHASLVLTSGKIRMELQPDVVIVIGRTTLSRSINALIQAASREIVIDPRVANVDIKRDADQIFLTLPTLAKLHVADPAWNSKWSAYSQSTAQLLTTIPEWSEGSIARSVAAVLPESSSLFVSSSRPIRDLEGFAAPRAGIETFANRGLAGIDGNISTALGIASQRTSTVAILGDLSFLHDVNALVGAKDFNARLLVINNDGGGIFSTLPQHNAIGFEKIFGTPHGLDLEAIAKGFGIPAITVSNLQDLRKEMQKPITGLSVVVVTVPSRDENARTLLSLYKEIEAL